MDTNNEGNPSEFRFSAEEIGFELAKQYYAVLDRMPEQAWRFYTERGEHRTVREDGTVVVARTWRQIQRMLLSCGPADGVCVDVDKVTTTACDDSLDSLMVQISGEGYSQTFVVEYQDSENRSYAIAASVTMYLPAKLTVDPSLVTNSAPAANPAPTVNPAPAANPPPAVNPAPPASPPPAVNPASVVNSASSANPAPAPVTDSAPVADPTPAPRPVPAQLVESRARSTDNTTAAARHHQPAIACTLFVGNLLNTTTEQYLTNMFSAFGPVLNVRIVGCKDRDGNPVRFSYALIRFDTPASATKALAHRPLKIDGRVLNVKPKQVGGPRGFRRSD